MSELTVRMGENIRIYRRANRMTLSELAEMFAPPLTKSCLNHRLRKLVDLARKLEEKEKENSKDESL